MWYAKIRLFKAGNYYPILVGFNASDARIAAELVFTFTQTIEAFTHMSCAVEAISLSKPKGVAISIELGKPIMDEGLQRFIGRLG